MQPAAKSFKVYYSVRLRPDRASVTSDTAVGSERGRTLVTVRRTVNEHGTMTVEVHDSNEHRQVVAFAADLRAVFVNLPTGTTVPVEMERLHTRGNCWWVTSIGPTGRGGAGREDPETARRLPNPTRAPR
jgi:hypothetical protein